MSAVRIGAAATALVDVANGRRLVGSVTEAGAELDDRRSGRGETVSAAPTAGGESAPGDRSRNRSTHRVRIAFPEAAEFASLETPIRIRIAAPAESLAVKALRLLRETFRFD
jgi:hypothetical protein